MDTINTISEKVMLVRTHQKVIDYRGSLYNAARKWWWCKSNKPIKAEYVMVDVDGIVQEVYKPTCWHKEFDPETDLIKFKTERWVFGKNDDSDDGKICKTELAPDNIRAKYNGKPLSDFYRYGNNKWNPVRYSF